MYQRIAREQQPANAAIRQAPHPDHHIANAIGKTTLLPHVAPHFAPADRYTIGIEAAQRQVRAVRTVLLPALIKALRANAKQAELMHAAMQLRYMLTSANEQVCALEKAATYRDPMLQFLRREIDTLVARSRRLGVYQGREHLIPRGHEEESIKHKLTKAHRTLRPADHKHEPAVERVGQAVHVTRPPNRPPTSTPSRYRGPVQRKAAEMAPSTSNVHEVAAAGVAHASSPLPFASIIQKAFGRHDVSGVRVQIGGPAAGAAKALGAHAYATGNTIAFASQPDLHTVAHEVAHVIQQRAGVHVSDSPDALDPYEAHADRVADLVVAGASAEAALDELVGGATHRAVQRKKVEAAKPDLAGNFEIGSNGTVARVRRTWLREKPIERWHEVLLAMQAAGAVPWAQAEGLERFARKLAARFPSSDDIVTLRLDAIAIAIIGLPPDAPPVVERIGNDLLVAVPNVGSMGAGERIELDDAHDAERFEAIFRAVETFTGLPIVAKPPLSALGASTSTAVLRLHDRELATMFGAATWSAWKQPKQKKTASAAPAAHAPDVSNVRDAKPGDAGRDAQVLSAEERKRVATWFEQQGATPTQINRAVYSLIAEIESDEALSAAVLEQMQRGAGNERTVDQFALRYAIEQARLQLERARLGFDKFERRGQASLDPIATVGARLVQRGLLISGETAHFEVELDDSFHSENADASPRGYRQQTVEWAIERVDAQGPAAKGGKPIVAPIRLQTRLLVMDHAFELGQHEQSGMWTVHAFVRDSHFAPRHVSTTVEVKTERARMADLRREAFAGLEPSTTTTAPHTFDLGAGNAALAASMTTAAPLATGTKNAHGEGTMTRGELPADFHARSGEERAADREAEIERTQRLVQYLRSLGDIRYKDALDAAERRLQHLRTANEQLAKDDADGWQPFELRGTYLSRHAELPSGPLDLYGTVARSTTPAGSLVLVHIRDHSQILGVDLPMYEGRGATFEQAFEQAFIKLCKEYPDGKVAVMAQAMDASSLRAAPTGKAIGFELATNTPWKRVKDKLYDSRVQWAINIAATALMIFQPETAPVILPILIAHNTVRNVDELIRRYENHTLEAGHVGITLAQIGLDLLPYARTARLLSTEVRLVAFEIANQAGMLVVMGLQMRDAIAQIQEADVVSLAEQYRELVELQKTTNPSDPELGRRQRAIRERAQLIRERVVDEWTAAVRDNGIFMVGAHVLTKTRRNAISESHDSPVSRKIDALTSQTEHETTVRPKVAPTPAREQSAASHKESSSRSPAREGEATRRERIVENPHAKGATPSGGLVTAPVHDVFSSSDPKSSPPSGWEMKDSQMDPTSLYTEIKAPNGATGHVWRRYDPGTRQWTMLEAFFDKEMPRWIEAGTPMVPGKGTPLIAFLDMRLMNSFGIGYGTLKSAKLSTIQNVEAVCQLEAQLRKGVDMHEAVRNTASVAYATTELVQSGHRIVSAKLVGGNRTPIERMLSHYENSGFRTRADHDAILKQYGIARTDSVLWNYDVFLDLEPFSSTGAQ